MIVPSGAEDWPTRPVASGSASSPATGRRGWRPLIVAGLLGAVGVGGLLLIPGDPSASWCQVSSNVLYAGRLGWQRARRILLAILGFMTLATVLFLVAAATPALAPALCVPWPQPAPAAPAP
jgi:hypothetical protein